MERATPKPRAGRRLLRSVGIAAELLLISGVMLSCAAPDPVKPAERGLAPAESTRQRRQALAGADGVGSVTAAGTVLNRYTALGQSAASGATSLQVASVAALSAGADALAAGDLVLVVQMQGASIGTTDDVTWGQVTALGSAGLYELVEVSGVNATANTIALSCALRNAYDSAGSVQVVRVPQYTTLTIAAGASITAPAWDGTTGGVVAIHAAETVTLNGDIDVSARGFRGGPADNASAGSNVDTSSYGSTSNTAGGRKGEGIAGLLLEYGRGAAANGGGGGNAHNAGGGGGANARRGAAWTGQGIFDTSVVGGALAWPLDPNYSTTGSQGGGRGGYTFSDADEDATMVGPDDSDWNGNDRRQRGGLGGRPVDNDPSARVFLGGGGGAGDGNNQHAGRGGNGGGLVLVLAGTVGGSGRILANGEAGVSADSIATAPDNGDSPGGGGGGGTVVVRASVLSGISIQARGGAGGNQIVDNGDEAEGPGGGGGGGYVALPASLTTDVTGGPGGTTNSPALTEFPSNGATRGGLGDTQVGATVTAGVPYCADTALPSTTITARPPNPTTDATGDFTFSSDDPAATFECNLDGVGFLACPASYATPALPDGSHTLIVRARDAVGNVDATPESYTWVVDTTPPDTTIAAMPADPTTDQTGDFSFTSTDPTATFECNLDSAGFVACPAAYTTPVLGGGSHTLLVRARDAAGNLDPTPASYGWTVDGPPPDTFIDDAPADPSSDPTADFGFSSSDSRATFECNLDGAGFLACPAVYATPALTDGAHTLSVRARDERGTVDATPASHTWLVDTTPPDTMIVLRPASPTADPTSDFRFSSNEPGATFECNLDGAGFVVCPATFATPALGAGPHSLQVRAVDPAGNVDPTPASYDWDVELALDTDGDGLSDGREGMLGSDPNDADSDDDGVRDGQEPVPEADGDGDGLIDVLDPDSDDDGLFDGTELGVTTADPDTVVGRGRFIADADPTTTTDPRNADTDAGGVPDGAEDPNRNGRIDAGERDPNDPADDATPPPDSDGDGLPDGIEIDIGTNPNDADSDDDGLPDGAEPNPADDHDGDGLINPLDPDSDNDGLFDGTETGRDCAGSGTASGAGFCRADADPTTTTGALDRDTDDGGVSDGSEDPNLDGRVDAGETDPGDGQGGDDSSVVDTDGDGLGDGLETGLGSSPTDTDSDDDGLPDGAEANPSADHDGDGSVGVLDPDSDGDGLFDGTETGRGCSGAGTDATRGQCIADADQGMTTTSVLVRDTDRGGVDDGSEDGNKNGTVDPGERDPLDPADDDDPPGTGGAGGAAGQAGSAGEAGASGAGAGGEAGAGASAGSGATGATAGSGASGAESPDDVVVLGGGLCAYHPGPASGRGYAALGALLALLLMRRQRR